MKMITTISIITLCLAANLVFSAEFVPGEMGLSQASETFGGGCCVLASTKSCGSSCSESGNHLTCKGSSSGYDTCTTSGTGACGDCQEPDTATLNGICPD